MSSVCWRYEGDGGDRGGAVCIAFVMEVVEGEFCLLEVLRY